MKKFLAKSIYLILCALVFFIGIPSFKISFADVPDGADCTFDASICVAPQTCVDINGEGHHSECQTPALSPGSACSTSETRCRSDQECVPDAPGSSTGTCKAITDGAICDPKNANSCGSYVTSPFACEPDPANPDTGTCKSNACNPKYGSEDCLKASYYCVEEPAGSGKGICKFSTNRPEFTPAPGPPCAPNALVDVSIPEVGDDGKPTGKQLTGKKCDAFLTGLGTISTDAAGFIRTGFGLLLAASGGVALLLIIRAGYKIMTSQGKPEAIQEGRDQIIAAIVGLILLIFAFVFLEVIGVGILRIPGLTP